MPVAPSSAHTFSHIAGIENSVVITLPIPRDFVGDPYENLIRVPIRRPARSLAC